MWQLILVIFSVLAVNFPAFAVDSLIDEDGDVEVLLAEGEAARETAAFTRKLAAKEKQETAAAHEEAIKMKAESEIKSKNAAETIQSAETEIKSYKGEQAALRKTIEQFKRQIAQDEKAVRTQLEEVEKMKIATQRMKAYRTKQI